MKLTAETIIEVATTGEYLISPTAENPTGGAPFGGDVPACGIFRGERLIALAPWPPYHLTACATRRAVKHIRNIEYARSREQWRLLRAAIRARFGDDVATAKMATDDGYTRPDCCYVDGPIKPLKAD